MSDKPIRVGFVGAGANTRKHHLPKLKADCGTFHTQETLGRGSTGEQGGTRC